MKQHQNVNMYRKRLRDWKRKEPNDTRSWRSPKGETMVRGGAVLSANKIPGGCHRVRGQCVRRVTPVNPEDTRAKGQNEGSSHVLKSLRNEGASLGGQKTARGGGEEGRQPNDRSLRTARVL